MCFPCSSLSGGEYDLLGLDPRYALPLPQRAASDRKLTEAVISEVQARLPVSSAPPTPTTLVR